MSIKLTAFPTAFLVSPESTKKISLSQVFSKIKDKGIKKLVSNFSALKSVRVVTNLRMGEIPRLMSIFEEDIIRTGDYSYKLKNGLNIEWKYQNEHCCAILSGKPSCKIVPKYGEAFFNELDRVKDCNIRDINSEELFYYNYETDYTDAEQIIKELTENGVTYIKQTPTEIRAKHNNQNIRYYQDKNGKFILETEQKVSLVNIGIDNSMISNVEIRTNITENELKELLKNFGYEYNELNSETPLKMSSNKIIWSLENGQYTAQLKNIKANHIRGEVEHLFNAFSLKAGRDIRKIENKSTYTFTYKTNYTDKGILLNTLTEHGAKNITETNDKISCELFGMMMSYIKKSDTGAFELVIERVTDKNECESLISDLNDEYGLNIQELTYKKILDRINSENMRLESEEVLEDNSIVLTIEV